MFEESGVRHTASAGSRRFWGLLLLLTALGGVLRFTRLGAQSIWIDECMTIGWIDEVAARGWGSMLQNIHGPLHAASVVLASRISTQEWWLRLPSALGGTLAVLTLGLLARRVAGARTALTAAAIMAVSPFALYYAQEVRNYAFTFLFASVTLIAALRVAERPTAGRIVLFVLAELASALSNLNGLFLALGANLWLVLVLWRQRRAVLLGVAVHALVGLVSVPYVIHAHRQVRPERLVGVVTPGFGQAEPLRGETTLHPLALPYTAYAFSAGYSLGPTLEELRASPRVAVAPRHLPALFAVVLAFGLPFAAGLARWRDRRQLWLLVAVAGVVCGFTIWLAAMNLKPFNARYLSVLLPLYFLLLARGLWILPGAARLLSGAGILGLSLVSCFNYLFVPRYGRDDVRGAVRFVEAHRASGEPVYHINLITPLRYYDLRDGVAQVPTGAGESRDQASAFASDLKSSGARRVWYLECRPEAGDARGFVRQALLAAASHTEVHSFVGVDVLELRFLPPSADSSPDDK